MTYSISEFAALTGVSERALRYYHQRGLLAPQVDANGYRRFTSADADRLQLILFYKAAGFTLKAIAALLDQDEATRLAALRQQRARLVARQAQLSQLIAEVSSTIANQEDEQMADEEKFTAFKQDAIAQNRAQYGDEVTAKWGKQAQQAADQHFAGLDEATYQRSQALEQQLADTLKEALESGAAPASQLGKQAYQLHRQWLSIMWPKYTAAMHSSLMNMYEADARFADYYDQLAGAGASDFLIAAVRQYAK